MFPRKSSGTPPWTILSGDKQRNKIVRGGGEGGGGRGGWGGGISIRNCCDWSTHMPDAGAESAKNGGKLKSAGRVGREGGPVGGGGEGQLVGRERRLRRIGET